MWVPPPPSTPPSTHPVGKKNMQFFFLFKTLFNFLFKFLFKLSTLHSTWKELHKKLCNFLPLFKIIFIILFNIKVPPYHATKLSNKSKCKLDRSQIVPGLIYITHLLSTAQNVKNEFRHRLLSLFMNEKICNVI